MYMQTALTLLLLQALAVSAGGDQEQTREKRHSHGMIPNTEVPCPKDFFDRIHPIKQIPKPGCKKELYEQCYLKGSATGEISAYCKCPDAKNAISYFVCGDDGKEYRSEMELKSVACKSKKAIKAVKPKGPCKPKPVVKYCLIGCYGDRRDRALRVYLGTFNNVYKCAEKAKEKGYKAFGLQNGGECWSGANAHKGFSKHGKASNCADGLGGPWANSVYKLNTK